MPIVAQNVFLDTQVFEQELYDFDSTRFTHLKKLVDEGYAKVYLTEIARREVIIRMREHTAAAVHAINEMMSRKEIKRSLGVLRHLDPKFTDLFKKHKSKDLSAELESQFDQFCKDLKIEVLPNSLAKGSVESVLDDYFHQRAPFKEGKKKSEFPDAFSAAIIKRWCEKEKQNMIVVSDDDDWAGVCSDRLSFKKSLVEFFSTFPDPYIVSQLIIGIAGPKHDELKTKIEKDFGTLGFIPEGIVGEIDEVDEIHADFDGVAILEAKDGHAVAEIKCQVSFLASVSYELDGTGMWDPEDQIMRFVETGSDQITTWTEVIVEVELTYDESDPTNILSYDISLDIFDVMVDCNDLDRGW